MTPPNDVRLDVEHFIQSAADWTALSGGRTNRVWRVDTGAQCYACKLFDSSADNPLYPNLPAAEFETLSALAGLDLAPEALAQLNNRSGVVLIYRYVEGSAWRENPREVASLMAKYHGLNISLELRPIPSGSAALRQQTLAILAQCKNANKIIPQAIDGTETGPVQAPVLVHTDVVPNNLIVSDNGLRLIDWQCPGLGDPAEDIASFLSPAMQYLYGRSPLSPDQIDLFLAAYGTAKIVARYKMLAPFFHWRAAAYCLWKAERGSHDYKHAMSLELSALQKAGRQNDEAGKNNPDADKA